MRVADFALPSFQALLLVACLTGSALCEVQYSIGDQSNDSPVRLAAWGAGNGAGEPRFADDDGDVEFLADLLFEAAPESASRAGTSQVGDMFAGGGYFFLPSAGANAPTLIPIAAADRRFKMVENNSPFPTDRVFFNYHRFHNAIENPGNTSSTPAQSLDRFVFGIEKTLLAGMMSVELRIPFAAGLSSDQTIQATNNEATEFGNMALAFKTLLRDCGDVTTSAGFGLVLPTAENVTIFSNTSNVAVQMQNRAVYLQPFAAAQIRPTEETWVNLFCQFDFAVAGNPVSSPLFAGLNNQTYTDQHLMYLDLSAGKWLFRDPSATRGITGLATILELHYTTTLNDQDVLSDGSDTIQGGFNRRDILNITSALRAELCGSSLLTFYAVAPLRTGKVSNFPNSISLNEEKLFDVELGVHFSYGY